MRNTLSSFISKFFPMPCLICNNAREGLPDIKFRKIADFEASARRCKYCRFLVSMARERGFASSDRANTRSESIFQGRRSGGVHFHVYASEKGGSDFDVIVRDLEGTSEEERTSILAAGLSSTGSDVVCEWAKGQIADCSDSMPRDAWLESDVKLYESEGESASYATLSHRWGDCQPLRLLQENIAEFRHSISISALPKTFRDAIVFARKLGISYIWIDSLCIIQDSKEDWFEQSGKMAGIYERASVTLAATVAANGSAGCFIDHNEEMKGYVTDGQNKIEAQGSRHDIDALVKTADDSTAVLFVRGVPSHTLPRVWTDAGLPLLQRGWVYQERFLSPRILHFGSVDLIFECNQSIGCYCKHEGATGSRHPRGQPIKPQHAYCFRPGADPGQLANRWSDVIEEYTCLDLTFDSDRLPAIAGIAKHFSRHMSNAKYMAGIWEDFAVKGLAWRVDNPVHKPPVDPSNAPSWSWVPASGRIFCWHSGGHRDGPTIEKVVFDRNGVDEFMTLKSGIITLTGYFGEVRLRAVEDKSHGFKFEFIVPGVKNKYGAPMAFIDYMPDIEEITTEWDYIRPRWCPLLASSTTLKDLPESEDLDETSYHNENELLSVRQFKETVAIMFLGAYYDDGGGGRIYMLVQCLDGNTQTYKRIGIVRASEYPKEFGLHEKRTITII